MSKVLQQAIDLWLSGGWAMVPLAVNALLLYGKAIDIWLELRAHHGQLQRHRKHLSAPLGRAELVALSERRDYHIACRYLAEHGIPVERARSLDDLGACFGEVRARELPPINRDLRFLKVAISTAPLLGLLGTVTGMFSTFAALSQGTGGKAMDAVAGGISEALITTQTGLMIALPGTLFYAVLARRRDDFAAFLTHLEALCMQQLHARGSLPEMEQWKEAA
jgi:biopolymer transport protein ExbB